jgi:hypothetical protein
VEHRDNVQERRHEPQVVEECDQRHAREHDGERTVREEPAIRLPREQHDERCVERERDDAGNEIRMNATDRQDAVVRGEILPRDEARRDAAPKERKAAEVDDDHRPLRRLPARHVRFASGPMIAPASVDCTLTPFRLPSL